MRARWWDYTCGHPTRLACDPYNQASPVLLGRLAIVALAISVAAAYTVIAAEASRVAVVAAWGLLFPTWFTRLHPGFRTPTRSLTVIVLVSLVFAFLASAGT